jgi:hypothetical protein
MKFATKMFAIAVTMLPLLATAQLGQSQKLVTNVPFAFRVGQKLIPAGQCVVERTGTIGHLLLVRNFEAKTSQFVLPRASGNAVSSTNALVFHKYGDRYFLAGIKIQGSDSNYQIPESKAEAEVQAANVTAPQEVLLALK